MSRWIYASNRSIYSSNRSIYPSIHGLASLATLFYSSKKAFRFFYIYLNTCKHHYKRSQSTVNRFQVMHGELLLIYSTDTLSGQPES